MVCSIRNRSLEWILLYSFSFLVNSVFLFYFIGRLYFTVGKSFSHHKYSKYSIFFPLMVLRDVPLCRYHYHVFFLSCILFCAESNQQRFTMYCVLMVCLFFLPESNSFFLFLLWSRYLLFWSIYKGFEFWEMFL
jgi:hypothetical protein